MIYLRTIYRNQKNYLYIIIISMLITILVVLNMFLGYYNYLLYEEIGNKIENRTIEIDKSEEEYTTYIKNNEIENIYARYSINCKLKNQELSLKSYYEIQEQRDNNTIIINKQYAKEHNLKIGESIKLVIDEIEKEFRIVEMTDNNYLSVYINQKDLDEIAKLNKKEPTSYIMVISKYNNVDKWLTKINNTGGNARIENNVGEQEIHDLNKLIKVSNYCIVFFTIISLLFIYTIFISINTEEFNYNNMLIILGWRKYKVRFQLSIRKCLIILNSLLLSMLIILISNNINNLSTNGFNWLTISYLNIPNMVMILLIIIILCFTSSHNKCFKKIT